MPALTATDVIDRVRISDVAEALGIKLDRARRRGVASWREGCHFSVSFDDTKNVWHDFVSGEGGGVLDLVQRIHGCARKEALSWLADYAGVALEQRSQSERCDWARRMREARPEAEALVRWKQETLEALRAQRNRALKIYYRAKKFIFHHDVDECEARGNLLFDLAVSTCERFWPRVEELDIAIDRLTVAEYADLLRRFRGVA